MILWGSTNVENANYFEATTQIAFTRCLIALAVDYNVRSTDTIEKLYSFAWIKADSIQNRIKFVGPEIVTASNSISYFTICQ